MTQNQPPRPWGEMTVPTPEMWLQWIDSFGPDHDPQIRLDDVRNLLRLAERGQVCEIADHDRYPIQVQALAAQLSDALLMIRRLRHLEHVDRAQEGRYRLAWLSARRRARRRRIEAFTEGWGACVKSFEKALARGVDR